MITTDQKLEIYYKRKSGVPVATIAKEYRIDKSDVKYMIRLIDRHGEVILRKVKNSSYSPDLKKEIINKVLLYNQSIKSTAIEYGLLTYSTLSNWIKSYKANGYVIVENTKGRSPTMNINKTKKDYKEMTMEEKNKYNEQRIQYLEAENEYLKKLRAVVQARKNQQPKKK